MKGHATVSEKRTKEKWVSEKLKSAFVTKGTMMIYNNSMCGSS